MTYHEIVQNPFENFPLSSAVIAASEALANENQSDSLGAIFTKKEVVNFILDLIGYSSTKDLYTCRILEPSFGGGDFLIPIVHRLLESTRRLRLSTTDLSSIIVNSICAVELQRTTFDRTSALLKALLEDEGFSITESTLLIESWLKRCDFLLVGNIRSFDFVAGNPPYVRQELIPEALIKEYRSRYSTIYDRADLYIPFIERSLLSLKPNGKLGFICADRWMKNRYGGPLRKLVAEKFSLKYYIDMSNTSAFHSDVVAYPAITIFERSHSQKTKIAYHPVVDADFLHALANEMLSDQKPTQDIREVIGVVAKSEPWLLESSDQMDIIRKIEKNYPAIEEVGCKIGIGVATGADKIFISDYDDLDVEEDRKLRLVTTKDLKGGEVNWTGQAVINPFLDSGGVVNLSEFPRLNAYLQKHKATIEARHVSKKNPTQWFRTIDRITPSLALRPKLLIPDIKGDAHVVFEAGELYPHHNLYYVVSDDWDLRALQGVLLSSITKLFVANYSTKMRGGYLRFQAQYLRRIRLPKWETVKQPLRNSLTKAAINLDLDACNRAAFELYELSASEQAALGGDEVDGS